jgi:hypothetical protein
MMMVMMMMMMVMMMMMMMMVQETIMLLQQLLFFSVALLHLPIPTTAPNLNTQNNLSLPCPPHTHAPHFPAPPAPLRSSCSHRLLSAGVSGIKPKRLGICEKDLVFAFASAMSASLEEARVTLEKRNKWSRGGREAGNVPLFFLAGNACAFMPQLHRELHPNSPP